MRNLYLHLACFILVCSGFSPALAQNNYVRISSRIDSLSSLCLPKSALVEVNKLDQLARKNGNPAQIIRVAMYRITLQSYIEENALAANINTLRQDVKRSGYPAKPVLQSLLAETFWKYYQQNRWQINQRSRLLKPDPDFTRWDLTTLLAEVSSLYQSSLINASQLQHTPINVLDDVLTGDKTTRHLRPTLYDLLAHRALDFYLTDEASIDRPREAFNLNDDRLLADSRTFSTLKLNTTDTTAILYQGVKLLQQLTQFHLADGNTEALADVDLKRLQLVYNKSNTAQKDIFYENALKAITQKLDDKPISADAWVLLGRYYQAKDSLVDTHRAYTVARKRFPESIGGKNALAGLSQLEEKTLSVTVESENVPGRPMLALMSYKNVSTAQVKVYRLSVKQMEDYQLLYEKAQNEMWQSVLLPESKEDYAKLMSFIQSSKQVQHQTLNLPGNDDYRRHTIEFKLDALPAGNYILIADIDQKADSSLKQITTFKVSSLAYTTRLTPQSVLEVVVLHRYSGKPLKAVKVRLAVNSFQYDELLKSRKKSLKVFEGVTDGNGKYVLAAQQSSSVDFMFTLENDTLIYKDKYISGEIEKPTGESKPKTILFTDRQIYRPGQTLYFKGLELDIVEKPGKILPGKEIGLQISDHTNKVLQRLSVKTNEFGSFSGSFLIPKTILRGAITIRSPNGSLSVRVEEYKRPTFKVDFAEIKDTFRFNDSVSIKGTATAFAGYGLTMARVAYRVQRLSARILTANANNFRSSNRYSYWPPVTVASDTILTDNQGNYTVKFKALPNNGPLTANTIHQYEITVDITDASGETRSGKSIIQIGAHDINLQAYLPTQQRAGDSVKVPVKLTTLNNQPLKGKLQVLIYSLKSPGRLFINRLWSEPQYYSLSATDYKNLFPDYAYRMQDQFANWPVDAKLADQHINITGDQASIITLGELYKQPAGIYRITMKAIATNGDTASITQYLEMMQASAKPVILAKWLLPLKTNVKAGQQAEFLVGTGTPAYILAERYRGPTLISSNWIKTNARHNSKFLIYKHDGNDAAVQYMMLYHNRLYNSYQSLNIQHPEKELNLTLATFRDLLQPGQKEQWKLQVKGFKNELHQAEIVAGMYDASLDDLKQPESWPNALELPKPIYRYYDWRNYDFVKDNSTQLLKRNTYYPYPVTRFYQQINWFGYDYFGEYNHFYHRHLKNLQTSISNSRPDDQQLERQYNFNAGLVKDGYDISGIITDDDGMRIAGVTVSVKGKSWHTTTNSKGFYKIKVPVNAVILVSFIGYTQQEIKTAKATNLNIKLKADGRALNEIVVVSYGKQNRSSVLGVVTYSQPNEVFTSIERPADLALTVALRDLPASAGAKVYLRGQSSIPNGKEPLCVIDGVVAPQGMLTTINPNDILTVKILNAAEATAIYGAQGANGVLMVTTKTGVQKDMPIVIRKNFNETAFFHPQLHTDESGQVTIDFTVPESLTKWRFRALAHTPQLASGYVQQDAITQKQLMISANLPRFLREGDTVSVSARVSNLSLQPVSGKVELQLFNAVNRQPVSLLMNTAEANQAVELKANTNQAVSFKMLIPTGLDALTYRLTVSSNTSSDGEENTVPVLPNRMLVTESMPMMVRAGQSKAFNFDKLINQLSKTLVNKTLTLEYTKNPAWYAVQALPYLMEFPYECSEQTFSRYLSNSMSAAIVNRNPRIKTIFERWKTTDSKALLSNLEKNPELKTALLEETPWLHDAVSEADQKKRIALLFDLNKLSYEQDQTLDKLQSKQLPGGGFPWFSGTSADRYITQHIVAGIGQLYHMGIAEKGNQKLNNIAGKAITYIDAEILSDSKRSGISADYLSAIDVHAWYARSYFADKPLSAELANLRTQYVNKATRLWLKQDIYEQALIALTLQGLGKAEVTKAIIRSLLERAQQSEDMGMYWAANRSGLYWNQSPIETQALLIELFTEAGGNPKAVEEMKIWLLRNKQTSNWRTTKATAAACYALLIKGADLLTGNDALPAITLGGKPLAELKPDIKAEAGTGYLKTSWADELVKPALGKVQVNNGGKTVSWGALYWQYTEQLNKITPSTTDLKLERKYFIQKEDAKGKVLTAVDAQHQPNVGDLVKVVVYLKAGRDYEYIHLKDMRPSGTEPVDVLSEYKYQDGLYYYQVTKDVATNFFISRLNKGNYVFEYELRVSQLGNFSTGISTVQSMYAPEFGAHSEGRRLTIGK